MRQPVYSWSGACLSARRIERVYRRRRRHYHHQLVLVLEYQQNRNVGVTWGMFGKRRSFRSRRPNDQLPCTMLPSTRVNCLSTASWKPKTASNATGNLWNKRASQRQLKFCVADSDVAAAWRIRRVLNACRSWRASWSFFSDRRLEALLDVLVTRRGAPYVRAAPHTRQLSSSSTAQLLFRSGSSYRTRPTRIYSSASRTYYLPRRIVRFRRFQRFASNSICCGRIFPSDFIIVPLAAIMTRSIISALLLLVAVSSGKHQSPYY